MTYTAYRCRKSPDVWDALVRGFGARDVPVSDPLQSDTVPIIGGLDFGSSDKLRQVRADRRPYRFVDNGYLATNDRDGRRIRYRVVPDAYAHHWLSAFRRERFDALGLEVKPWRKTGRHVLVCTSSDRHAQFFGLADFARETLATLRAVTDRPVIVRPKGCQHQLAHDLQDCHAVIAWSSKVAVDAVLAGIPVFVGPESPARPVGTASLHEIETPRTPDREAWLAGLAWGQFTVEEIASGLARAAVQQWRIVGPAAA